MSFGDGKNGSLHERVSELEHMVQTRNESIHNLTKLLDERLKRIEELEAKFESSPRTWEECYACQEAHDRALFNARERENELTRLVLDIWTAYSERADASFHPVWEVDFTLKERMTAMGIEVEC